MTLGTGLFSLRDRDICLVNNLIMILLSFVMEFMLVCAKKFLIFLELMM